MWSIPVSTTFDSTVPDQFCKGGRKICVGDCALFQPAQGSSPFIGVIRKVALRKKEEEEEKEASIWLVVNWIYRPADVKLARDILLEAAPNEVFYSFHKDEIPAASLLHPCKVAFLGKGVQLPSGVSSYVCRRVYDIDHKCLCWLTDKYYIKEQQEEIRKLLNKTRLEMDGKVQSESPKLLNSHPQLKSGSDSTKSSSSSLPKGKKSVKHDNGSEDKLMSQFTQKGGLVDFEGVRKLLQLMHPEVPEAKIDLVGRIMLVDVISATESFDCLGRFVQLRGLPLLDEWLQEVRRGKIGGGTENVKSVDEFVLAILRALEKLPVNLHSLQTCNVGKSVNYLRSHKNSDIQKKARTLVDIWKKRVEAEMNVIDANSGLSRSVSWPSKPEVSHAGSSKTGGTNEVDIKTSIQQQAPPKSPSQNLSNAEAGPKVQAAYPVSNGAGKSSRGSPNGAKTEKVTDVDHANNQRLIVRLPNTGRSPAPSASEGSVEEPTVALKVSPSSANSERSRLHDKKARAAKSISERAVLNAEPSKSKEAVVDESHKGKVSPADAQLDERRRESEDCEILKEASKAILSSETALESGKSFEASFNSINALVDSCLKISEASASASISDDVGIKLLASVAAGEIPKPGTNSQFGPSKSSSAPEDTCSDSTAKLRPSDGATANTQGGKSAALSAIEETKKECGTQVKTSSSSAKDDKLNHVDDCVGKNNISTEVEVVSGNVKVEDIANEKAAVSNLIVAGEVKNQVDNEQPLVKPSGLNSLDGDSKIVVQSYPGVVLKTPSLDDKSTTVSDDRENVDKKVNACNDVGPVRRENSPQKTGQLKLKECKSDGAEANGPDEWHASSVQASPSPVVESETASRLDFDLNEGFPVDDEIQGEQLKSPVPFKESPLRLSCPLPYHLSSMSGSIPASVTVTAAAKGAFVHPENLPRTKGELGWKGSAATSAFRPAEPRKVLELPLRTTTTINTNSTTGKRAWPPLDIDLNVADERSCEDITYPYPTKRLCTEVRSCDKSVGPAGGLDFDLNSVGECPDSQPFSGNSRYKSENLSFLRRSGGFSNGEMSTSRNFDLNDGPCIDEAGTEATPVRPNTRSNAPFLSQVPGVAHAELGNLSSWFPPGNSYSIPSFLPSSRGEQSYAVPSAGGPQRVFVPSVNGEMLRGAVLSSSPALVFPPSTTFPYPGYPFEAVASNSFSGSSAICYPAIPSQLEGSTTPSQYPRPYIMGAAVGHENRKWGNFDLNSGPRSTTEMRQMNVGSPCPAAQVNEQLHMYQMAGGMLKRKEPDSGWEMSTDRYKHS